MLIEFSVSNFLSFKEEVTLSMVASKDEALDDNIIKDVVTPWGDRLLKSAVIYGPNASGKTNFLKALTYLKERYDEALDPEFVTPYRLDLAYKTQPTCFKLIVLNESHTCAYTYTLMVIANRVVFEKLEETTRNINKSTRLLFERQVQNDGTSIYEFKKPLLKVRRTVENETSIRKLALRTLAEANQPAGEDMREIFFSLGHLLGNPPEQWFQNVIEFLEYKIFKNDLIKILNDADCSVNDIECNINRPSEVINEDVLLDLAPKLVEQLGSGALRREADFDFKIKRKRNDDVIEEFDLFTDESAGTRQLIALAPFWILGEEGLTLFVDELESHLHPIITRNLIEQVHSGNGFQLIFTTHDSTLLDTRLFRHDQIWFTEKHPDGYTELYSLADIKGVRQEENIQKGYIMGRYGAIPIPGGPCLE